MHTPRSHRATPTAAGHLRVADPAPDLRYDMGNTRLFAALDGSGNILTLRLPEGIPILRAWNGVARVDGRAVTWHSAEAIGRQWTLCGSAFDAEITLITACDNATPALVQHWHVTNSGPSDRVFTLSLDVTFDLRAALGQIGLSSERAQMGRLLRDNPLVRRVLGSRRWQAQHWILEAQKRLSSDPGRASVTVEPLPDGVRVVGDVSGELRAGHAPLSWQAAGGQITLVFRGVVRPGQSFDLPVMVGAGTGLDTHWAAAAEADAAAYAAWLSAAFEHDDPLLRSLFAAGLNVALSMYKELPSGFAGLWAGPGYAFPPRIYFRDGYWTALAVLPYRPVWVRRHLIALADGVTSEGVCSSGVIDAAALPLDDQADPDAVAWMPDHQDSPAFFVLLLHDYLAWTGDETILTERNRAGRSLWDCAQSCLNRLVASPAKDHAPNDWADNVLRSEWVTYDLALLIGALKAAAAIARLTGDTNAAMTYVNDAHHIRQLLDIHCWDDARGHYIDYRRTGDYGGDPMVEDHLALDTLLALRFGAASEDQAARVLENVRARLQTRHNLYQPYEDWGVMCCWPPYKQGGDLFAKSARPYQYHNGAEWPYLSAIYAELLLDRADPADRLAASGQSAPDWAYALMRWWAVSLERGWLTPVEYHSPAHPPGALLQGWSGLAVSAMLAGGWGLRPALDGSFERRTPPWGASVARHVLLRGTPLDLTSREER